MRTIDRQHGATLVIALIMLVLLTLIAISSLNSSTSSLRVAGNQQETQEALNAAQEAIERTISSTQFTTSPSNALPTPCGANNTLCPDVTGDGVGDFTVTLLPEPKCVSAKAISNAALDPSSASDVSCLAGQSQQFGISGGTSGDSLCAYTVWEITAEAKSNTTKTKVTTVQGVGMRVSADSMLTSCN